MHLFFIDSLECKVGVKMVLMPEKALNNVVEAFFDRARRVNALRIKWDFLPLRTRYVNITDYGVDLDLFLIKVLFPKFFEESVTIAKQVSSNFLNDKMITAWKKLFGYWELAFGPLKLDDVVRLVSAEREEEVHHRFDEKVNLSIRAGLFWITILKLHRDWEFLRQTSWSTDHSIMPVNWKHYVENEFFSLVR